MTDFLYQAALWRPVMIPSSVSVLFAITVAVKLVLLGW